MQTTDINPDSPYATLADLRAALRAQCPTTLNDGGYNWNPCHLYGTVRNGKNCINLQWRRFDGGATADWYFYYNAVMIGTHDYAEFCAIGGLPWQILASNEWAVTYAINDWISLIKNLFGFPTLSWSALASQINAYAWGVEVTATPQPPYDTNPGILPYVARWCEKYSDKVANVQGSAAANLDTTSVTPNYTVTGAGGAGTFQSDFNAGIQAIIAAIQGLDLNVDASVDLSGLETKMDQVVAKLGVLNTLIDPQLGDYAEAGGIVGGLDSLRVGVDSLGLTIAESLETVAQGTDVQDLVTTVDVLQQTVHTEGLNVAEALDLIGTYLVDPVSGQNLAEKTGAAEVTLDTANLEVALNNVVAALIAGESGTSVADAIRTAALEIGSVDGVTAELLELRTIFGTKADAIVAALIDEVAENIGDLEGHFGLTGTITLGMAASTVAVTTALGALDLTVAGMGAGLIPTLGALASIATILGTLATLAGDKTMELGPVTSALFNDLEGLFEQAFLSGQGSYVRDLRDALGWSAETGGNGFDTSIRGRLEDLIENLQVTSEDGETTIPLSELLADFNLQVRWPDVMFQYP